MQCRNSSIWNMATEHFFNPCYINNCYKFILPPSVWSKRCSNWCF